MVGKGGTAEVIEYGDGKVCKLFYKGQPEEYVKLEYENAKEMYKNHITVPKAFEIVNIEGRIGIIYERIYGKSLRSLLNRENRSYVLSVLIKLHRELLSCRSKILLSYKDFLKEIVKRSLNPDLQFIEEINFLPDGDSICHGDFHLNNILIKSDGTAVIIDFMNVCRGPFLYDIARTFSVLLREAESSLADEYLSGMGVLKSDISGYMEVIEKCRKYEKSLNEKIRSCIYK